MISDPRLVRSTPDAMAALGIAPHSGWAAVIGVGGRDLRLRVLVRERIELADPRDPRSRQPYHAAAGLPIHAARRLVTAWATTAEHMASAALRRIVRQLGREGQQVVGLGLLDSAGHRGRSLAETLASHALIHTADGNHYRDAIAAAAKRCHLQVWRARLGSLEREAAAATGEPPEALREALEDLRRAMGPPWRADQKVATLLGWLALASGRSSRAPG